MGPKNREKLELENNDSAELTIYELWTFWLVARGCQDGMGKNK